MLRRRVPPRRSARAAAPRGSRADARRHRPGAALVHAVGPGGAGAARRDRLRRGQLERHRDRLDLRWPRHLQEVQGPGRSTATSPVSRLDVRAFSARPARDGWRLACLAHATQNLTVDVPPLMTRPKAATVGVGRQVILRPAVQKRFVELTEPTPGRPADRPAATVRRHRRPRAAGRTCTRCDGCRRCCGRPTSRSRR